MGRKATHSESRICSELQKTFDSRQTQVGGGDVQGGAEVKVAAGGIDLCGDTRAAETNICLSIEIFIYLFYISNQQHASLRLERETVTILQHCKLLSDLTDYPLKH